MAQNKATRMRRPSALGTRKAVVSSMHPALRAVYADLQSGMVDKIEDNLRFYHQMGRACLDVKQNPDKYLTEEQRLQNLNPFSLLEEAMSSSRSTLQKAAAFAEKYDAEDLKRLFGYRNQEDPKFRLHWGHVLQLLSVAETRLRIGFEEKAIMHLWDPLELQKNIQAHYGGPRRAGGRPLAVPNTVPSQINQMVTMTGLWARRNREVWNGEKHNVFKNIMDLPPEKCTPKMMKSLQGLRTQWEEMQADLVRSMQTIETAITQIQSRLDSDAPPAATPTKASKAQRTDAPPPVNGSPRGTKKSAKERAAAVAARVRSRKKV